MRCLCIDWLGRRDGWGPLGIETYVQPAWTDGRAVEETAGVRWDLKHMPPNLESTYILGRRVGWVRWDLKRVRISVIGNDHGGRRDGCTPLGFETSLLDYIFRTWGTAEETAALRWDLKQIRRLVRVEVVVVEGTAALRWDLKLRFFGYASE